MAIKIIDEPDIHLTRQDYERYMDEFQRSMMFYVGPYISFESWVRRKLNDRRTPNREDYCLWR